MKKLFFLLLLLTMTGNVQSFAGDWLRRYNVVWQSPSRDPLDSMPLSGSHGAGANVWVQDGSLWVYLGHSGAFDEQGRLLKAGCLRFTPQGWLLGGDGFVQELDLASGSISIAQGGLTLRLWFAGESLVVQSEGRKCAWQIAYGTWRDRDRQGVLSDMHGGRGDYTADCVESREGALLWYHCNGDHPFDLNSWSTSQGIPVEDVNDVTSRRVFGGALAVKGGLRGIESAPVAWQYWQGTAWSGTTAADIPLLAVVTLGAAIDADPADWLSSSRSLLQKKELTTAKKSELRRWKEFWSRSYVRVNTSATPTDEAFKIGQNYQLFRYMLACNQGGELPLLFNGGIFTVDNVPHKVTGNNNDELPVWQEGASSPDFRRWMYCHFMSQNQRWLGRPTMGGGDADLLEPTVKFYRERAKTAAARARRNGAEGVVYTEPLDVWGLCCVSPLPNGLCGAEHLTYHFSMMLDEAWMALEAHNILGKPIEDDLDWIVGTVEFYNSYYRSQHKARTGQELADNGKLVLYPTNAVEHAGDCTNSVDAVSGLARITQALLQLEQLPADKRRKLEAILPTIPDIPVGERGGKRSILPGESFAWEYNLWEPTELIAAYPYRLVGVTNPSTVQLLRDTYATIPDNRKGFCKQDYSWMPNVANAAAMADPLMAEQRAIYKMANTEAPQSRFPAFFGPGHDWIPDHNWGGSGMVGIQEMLLAANPYGDGKIYLLHAWPEKWDVDFKLHAPGQTIVEAVVKDGKIKRLKTTPASRINDIVIDPRFK